ncbi:hypothetical protein [Ammoniphilus sp. YIM 78166]|uniref:hypothetical protein n=1 Tax=Ammoniphilus sp. YIM 78166 TaxID=1644106 RepID=UPI00142F71A7|nr:hypothetical protein [Ammoniphilus sp. YIM 78166]
MDNFYSVEKMVEQKMKEMEPYYSSPIERRKPTLFIRIFEWFQLKEAETVSCESCC